jgi:ferredoxin--NADP+ reductase
MNIDELELGPTRHARLVANTPLTLPGAHEDVRELTLELEDDDFRFEIGQSIAVLVAGPLDFGQQRHVRLYSIATTPAEADAARIGICVRRCSYLDPYSGERYPGVASNFLCDLRVGAALTIAGPVGLPFRIPSDPHANLLMVGLGTGIGPFRALIRHLYAERGTWHGKVRLFYGARTGLELVYMNDRRTDISTYLDQETFRAIEALSPRPAWDEPADLAAALALHEREVTALLDDPSTHVYLAGLASIGAAFDTALARICGGTDRWAARKAELVDSARWMEVLY